MTGTNTILRVQPVAPEREPWSDLFGSIVAALVGGALGGLFVMLGVNVLADFYPAAVPALGYWQSVGVVLGLGSIGGALRGPGWKWARR